MQQDRIAMIHFERLASRVGLGFDLNGIGISRAGSPLGVSFAH